MEKANRTEQIIGDIALAREDPAAEMPFNSPRLSGSAALFKAKATPM